LFASARKAVVTLDAGDCGFVPFAYSLCLVIAALASICFQAQRNELLKRLGA
jgi:hypothetical protein